jgi:hypothetical protein
MTNQNIALTPVIFAREKFYIATLERGLPSLEGSAAFITKKKIRDAGHAARALRNGFGLV